MPGNSVRLPVKLMRMITIHPKVGKRQFANQRSESFSYSEITDQEWKQVSAHRQSHLFGWLGVGLLMLCFPIFEAFRQNVEAINALQLTLGMRVVIFALLLGAAHFVSRLFVAPSRMYRCEAFISYANIEPFARSRRGVHRGEEFKCIVHYTLSSGNITSTKYISDDDLDNFVKNGFCTVYVSANRPKKVFMVAAPIGDQAGAANAGKPMQK
jgi:hypothetical protein